MDLNFSLEPLVAKLQAWLDAMIKGLPNFILAVIVLVIGIFLSRFLKGYFKKGADRMVSHSTVANLIANIATTIFMLLVIFLVLGILNLTTALQSLLAGAGVVGLAIGLAFQDPLLNLFSGIMISTRNFFNIGDLVELEGHFGKVRRISLRSTYIETLQGQEVILPNKTVTESAIKNFSVLGYRRVDLACGVSYGDDLEHVRRVTIEAIKNGVKHDESKPVQLFFNEFGNSSINYILRFWLRDNATDQVSFLQAQSDAIMAIKQAYDENDIMIPFPIRTLDFGIKGGEKLSEMLNEANISTAANANNQDNHRNA